MRRSIIRQQKNIFRFLTIFETRLKNYDEYFNNDYYQLNYIVHRCFFTDSFTVDVTMAIWNKNYFFDRVETTHQILSSLKSYCAIFSIRQIRIVRQLKKSNKHLLNLEERTTYGVYEKTIN
jgi:hypothetical protein